MAAKMFAELRDTVARRTGAATADSQPCTRTTERPAGDVTTAEIDGTLDKLRSRGYRGDVTLPGTKAFERERRVGHEPGARRRCGDARGRGRANGRGAKGSVPRTQHGHARRVRSVRGAVRKAWTTRGAGHHFVSCDLFVVRRQDDGGEELAVRMRHTAIIRVGRQTSSSRL